MTILMFLDVLQINSTQNNVNKVAFLLVFFEHQEGSSLEFMKFPRPVPRSKLPDFVTKKNWGATKQFKMYNLNLHNYVLTNW